MKDELFFPYKNDDGQNRNVGIDTLTEIYEHMADDLSKKIFMNRLSFSITKDFKYIRQLVLSNAQGIKLERALKEKMAEYIYIYGAGIRGERIGRIFSDINWTGYIDSVKEGECNGIKIYRMQEVPRREKAIILISNYLEEDIIQEQLISCGFCAENIIVLNDFDRCLAQEQYYEDFLDIKSGTMIDAGGYDGEEVIKYMNFVNDDNRKFYVFEPDNHNFEICKERLKKYTNGTIYNMGLSDKESTLRFDPRGDVDSRFSEDGTDEVVVTTLDKLSEKVCFLKADVEGAEYKMLRGASDTVKIHKPNIAVSVYHKKEDVWELPQILLDLNPNYKFYMRHYSIETAETVLYAVNNE